MSGTKRVVGRAVPLDRANVDTDQIIPAHWLKRIERTGYGAGLFEAWRKDPDFVLNDPRYAGATMLVAGANFGSGSSREHAAWALADTGYRAVIAPSFADIFRSNAVKNGIVPVTLEAEVVRALVRAVERDPALAITVDLETATVSVPAVNVRVTFPLAERDRRSLTLGLDEIALTLEHEEDIAAYERKRPAWLPRLAARR